MNIKEKTTCVFAIVIVISAVLDVGTTQVGVFGLGTKEIGVVASLAMKNFGADWWMLYLPYEATLLLVVFFGVRFVRTKTASRIQFNLLNVPAEHFTIIITYVTILNNTLQIIRIHG
ncbi:MAG: hypothetical protein M1503_13270 [Thaumarchaeota archaeon]|nr:hypothetical protein [Nitrososphaerota archaeon]